jgi:hypothetical protein
MTTVTTCKINNLTLEADLKSYVYGLVSCYYGELRRLLFKATLEPVLCG